MDSICIRRLIILLVLTIPLCFHPQIALSLTDAQTNIPVTTATQLDLGESPMEIQEGTVFELDFFIIASASILIHRLDENGDALAPPIIEETFALDPRKGDETTHITAVKDIILPEKAKYRITENYILEAALDNPFLPPNPFFKSNWTGNFDASILDAGIYKLSIDALWRDIRCVASGDLAGEEQVAGEAPTKMENVRIIAAVPIPIGKLIEATITFDGKLDKTTELNAVSTVSNPQASPAVVTIDRDTLLSVQLDGDITASDVKIDLSALNLDAQALMYDDGSHGDAVSGDKIYSLLITIPDSVSPGAKKLPVTVTDDDDNNFVTNVSLEITQNLPQNVIASGVVLFERREDQSERVALSLRKPGSLDVLETQYVQTDSNGNFSVSFSVPSGEYDLIAKANGFLQSIARNVTLPATDVEFDPSPLLGGDSNNDNKVTLPDFSLLAYSFSTLAGDELFNPDCDYNGDGAITIKDFSILAANFGILGVLAPAKGHERLLVDINGDSYGRPRGNALTPISLDAIDKSGVAPQGEFKLRVESQSAFKIKSGDAFNITIYAEDVIDMYSSVLQARFNPTLFKLNSCTAYNYVERAASPFIAGGMLYFAKEEEPGLLTIFSSVTGDKPGISGAFTIATLQFQAIRANKPSGEMLPQIDTVIALDQIATCDTQNNQSLYPPKRLKIRLTPPVNHLAQNYPNPFNPDTWIPFELSDDSDVIISIYDATGKLVRSLKLGHLAAGSYMDKSHAGYWDGKNEFNERVSSGVYFYHLQTDNFSATCRMAILK